jgi:hypothetical protein
MREKFTHHATFNQKLVKRLGHKSQSEGIQTNGHFTLEDGDGVLSGNSEN